MMRRGGNRSIFAGIAAGLVALTAVAASAQPADLPIQPATTSEYPTGVQIVKTDLGMAYADKRGQTLYGLDMRTLLRAGADPAQYCTGQCAADWVPLLAPKGASINIEFPKGGGPNAAPPPGFVSPQNAPDWTVIKGPQGPQYVYKGWHLVFIRKGEKLASTAQDGAENLSWNVLRYIPPVPTIVAPGNVTTTFLDGSYVLTDSKGGRLYTGSCADDCAGWIPFSGGYASAGVGNWRIKTDNETPQWTYRGAPVFITAEDADIPAGGKALRP